MKRPIVAAIGAAIAMFALVAVFNPGLVTGLPFSEAAVLALGAMLVVGGLNMFRHRWKTPQSFAEVPDVEESIELPTPGDQFQEQFANVGYGLGNRVTRDRIGDKMETLVVETVQRAYGVSQDRAVSMIQAGSWTDDPFAAAFFTGELEGVSQRERLRERFGIESTFHHRGRRTIEATAELVEEHDE